MIKIVFDVETNGFDIKKHSVLSLSALMINKNNEIIEELNRFYYLNKNEKENQEAINVNGLNEKEITKRRGNANYAAHFEEDKKYIINFFENAAMIIAHNIDFDYGFLTYKTQHFFHQRRYCTMRAYQYLYNAPYQKNGAPKYPRLNEAINFLKEKNIKLHERIEKEDFHNSLYDCYCALELYKNAHLFRKKYE